MYREYEVAGLEPFEIAIIIESVLIGKLQCAINSKILAAKGCVTDRFLDPCTTFFEPNLVRMTTS